jgi:hypothetical protein
VIFCDTPGFNDTRGTEIDISNGVAVRKCIQQCRGILPVIIISNQLGDKLEKLRELADVLSLMFLKFDTDINCFKFIFTKFQGSESEKKSFLKKKFLSVKEELEKKCSNQEKVPESFKMLVSAILDSVKNGFIAIDPFESDRSETLENLLYRSVFIDNLSERISESLSTDSLNKLESQIDKLISALETSIKNLDFDLTIYKFKQLKSLKGLTNKSHINKKYQDIVEKLKESFKKECGRREKTFCVPLKEKRVIEDKAVEEFVAFINLIKKSSELFKDIDDFNLTEDKNFETMINDLISTFRNVITDSSSKLIFEAPNISVCLENLNKLRKEHDKIILDSLSQSSDFMDLENQMKTLIFHKIKEFDSELETTIKSTDFNAISSKLDVVKVFDEFFRKHFEPKDYEKYPISLDYEGCKNVVIKQIIEKATKENIFKYFERNTLNTHQNLFNVQDNIPGAYSENIKELYDSFEYLRSASSCFSLQIHIPQNVIQEHLSKLNSRTENIFNWFVQKLSDKINALEHNRIFKPVIFPSSYISKDPSGSTITISDNRIDHQGIVQLFSILHELNDIVNKGLDLYQLQVKLFSCINNLKTQIEDKLIRCEDLDQVDRMIDILSNFKWLNDFGRKDLLVNAIEDFDEIYRGHEVGFDKFFNDIDLDNLIDSSIDQNSNDIDKIKKIIENSKSLSPLVKKLKNLYKKFGGGDKGESLATEADNDSYKIKAIECFRDKLCDKEKKFENEITERINTDTRLDVQFLKTVDFFIKVLPLQALKIEKDDLVSKLKSYTGHFFKISKIEDGFKNVLNANYDEMVKLQCEASNLNATFVDLFNLVEKHKNLLCYLPSELNTEAKLKHHIKTNKDKVAEMINFIDTESSKVEKRTNEMTVDDMESRLTVLFMLKQFIDEDHSTKIEDCRVRLKNLNNSIIDNTKQMIGALADNDIQDIIDNIKQLLNQSKTGFFKIEELKKDLKKVIKNLYGKLCNDICNLPSQPDNNQMKSIRELFKKIKDISESQDLKLIQVDIDKDFNLIKNEMIKKLRDVIAEIKKCLQDFNSKAEVMIKKYSDDDFIECLNWFLVKENSPDTQQMIEELVSLKSDNKKKELISTSITNILDKIRKDSCQNLK